MSRRRARVVLVRSNRADLEVLAGFFAERRIRAIVERMSPLGDAAAAQRVIETERARGKVVLRIG